MKKIYFASSIRGEAFSDMKRKKWLDTLSEFGDVINISAYQNFPIKDRDIYYRDLAWIQNCDIMIAEVSNPSLGVGYEICFANMKGIPVLCFYSIPRSSVSAMIVGNEAISCHHYELIETLRSQIEEAVKHYL